MTTEHLGTAQVYVSERDSMFVLLQNPESSARSHFNGVYFEVGENSQIVGGGADVVLGATTISDTLSNFNSILCFLNYYVLRSYSIF